MRVWQGGHWTLDNAANNGTLMIEFGNLLRACDIDFDPIDRQVMCFLHIVNICCQHLIANFTNIDLAETATEFVAVLPPSLPDRQTFEEAIKCDPVALGHDIVRVLRNSGQRQDLFDNIIQDGNEKGWFEVGDPPVPVQLRPVQLLRDMITRWDTVYYMVRRLREMRLVSRLDFSLNLIDTNSIHRRWNIFLLSQLTEIW
jgi:hypothetical protein